MELWRFSWFLRIHSIRDWRARAKGEISAVMYGIYPCFRQYTAPVKRPFLRLLQWIFKDCKIIDFYSDFVGALMMDNASVSKRKYE